MGVREKLNRSHVNGALLAGGALGVATGSFSVFLLAVGLVIALEVYSGGIRPFPQERR